MTRDHRLDLSGYKPPSRSYVRPNRDRSRSPKRLRTDSRRPSTSAIGESLREKDGRGRQEAIHRAGDDHRERSPNYSPRPEKQGTQTRPHKRPRKQKEGAETTGLSDKIHSLRRLLEKATDMPANIRQEKERELQGYMADQRRRQASREKNAVTSRYHFVRFMERKKADRLLKKMEKDFDSVMIYPTGSAAQDTSTKSRKVQSEEGAEANIKGSDHARFFSPTERLTLQRGQYERRLHEAKVDLNYTLYAPLDQKYISLYPSKPNRENDQRRKTNTTANQVLDHSLRDNESGIFRNDSGQKPPMWYGVEKAMENNTLEALRDGHPGLAGDKDQSQNLTFRSVTEQANGKRGRGRDSNSGGEDEGSDGDFFER